MMLCILKGISAFKMHKIKKNIRKPEKILGFTRKLRRAGLPKTQVSFYLALARAGKKDISDHCWKRQEAFAPMKNCHLLQ